MAHLVRGQLKRRSDETLFERPRNLFRGFPEGKVATALSSPRSRARRARRSRRNGRISREYTRGRRGGQTAGGSGPTSTRRRPTADRVNTAKGQSEPHGRRRVPKRTRPGRDNSPSRGPGTCAEGKAATNDPRGRRLHECLTNAPETRGAKNRRGEPDHDARPAWPPTPQRTGSTPQRDGPEAGRLRDGTARPANAEGTRTAKPHERWPATCPPRARRAANRPAR